MEIEVLNQSEFSSFLNMNSYELADLQCNDLCVICVRSKLNDSENLGSHPIFNFKTALFLNFDDITPNEVDLYQDLDLISDSDVEQIVNMIKYAQEKECSRFVISCNAGISRSGAIANVIAEYFKFPPEKIKCKRFINPNYFVKAEIKKKLFDYENTNNW